MKTLLLILATGTLAALAAIALSAQAPRTEIKAAPSAAEIEHGKALFADHCAICHYDHSEAQKMGPGLKGIYRRAKFADGKKVTDAGMTVWMVKGGEDMPPLKSELKPEEIRALLSYLKTL
jgi:mono/diheme cytochrome c family protein